MSDNDVTIQFTVQDAQAFKAWQRQQAAAAKMKKELDALKNSGNAAGKAMLAAAGNAGKQALAGVAALTGVGGAVSALMLIADQMRKEIANIRSRQAEAGNTQVDLGNRMLGAARKFTGTLTPKEVRSEILQAAERTGQDPGKIADVMAYGAAAKGPTTKEQAHEVMAASEAVVNFYPEVDDETAKIMTKSVLDIMNRFKLNSKEALGLVQKLDQAHHSAEPLDLATHAAPAVSGVAAFGGSAQESLALVSVLSQAMMDNGAESGTAAEKMAGQLRERLPEKTTGLKTTFERIKYLRDHPKEGLAYLEGGTIAGVKHTPADFGRSGARTHIEGLIGQNKETGYQYANMLDIEKNAGGKPEWVDTHKTMLTDIESNPEQIQAKLKRRLQSGSTQIQLANMAGGTGGISREGLQQLLKDAGLSDIEQQASMVKFEANTGVGKFKPIEETARQLRATADLRDSIRVPVGGAHSAGMGGAHQEFKTVPDAKASDEDKVVAQRLRMTADALDAIAPIAKKTQEEAIKEDLKVKPKPQPAPELVTPAVPANGQKLSSAKAAVSSARNYVTEASADGTVNQAEAVSAGDMVQRATTAVEAAKASISKEDFDSLKEQLSRVVQALDRNTHGTDKNTEATAENSGATKPAAPTQFSQGGPSPRKPINLPANRNNQASRGLDRRSPLIG